jgi:hypothetical protein
MAAKNKTKIMILFKVLWGIDAVVAIVILYFFFTGMADGSVSSFNMGLWIAMIAGLMAILFGSLWLKSHDHLLLAKTLLCILAVPALLYTLFFLY